MSDIRIVRDFPHSPETMWRAMTDPELVPLWTATGQGAKPENFEPKVGCHFRFVGKPVPGWDGIVRCEVPEVNAPELLRYSWRGSNDEDPTIVTYLIEPTGSGSRLTYEHTGFSGIRGRMMSELLGRVRRKMLDKGLPPVLDQLERPGAALPAV
jgi:uncharacterized protein YndB with AHSA1/START domain